MKARLPISIRTAPCRRRALCMFMCSSSPSGDSAPAIDAAHEHASRFPRPDVQALGLEFVGLALATGTGKRLSAPGHLRVRESCPGDLREVLSLQESAPDSGSPDRDILTSRRRDVPVHNDVGDLQPAAWLQYAEGLAENRALVGREVD